MKKYSKHHLERIRDSVISDNKNLAQSISNADNIKETLNHIKIIRENDKYPDKITEDYMQSSFFPSSIPALVNDLSNVTAAFYGYLLKSIGEKCGYENINAHSESLFYNLGKLKAEQALAKDSHLKKDCKAFATIAISAIYNASPEYNFSIEKFTERHTILTLTGIDRYYKIARQLDISEYIKWPTLLPFMQGIKETLNLPEVTIDIKMASFDKENETKCIYNFEIDH